MNMNSSREIWFTTSKSGRRSAWTFDLIARRTLPVKLSVAEVEIATGVAVECAKPEWTA